MSIKAYAMLVCVWRGNNVHSGRTTLIDAIYASDPFRAPPISLLPWLICRRSGKSEKWKRPTYSAFFPDKYVSSHYSAIVDQCGEQVYHSLKDN
jgi:hypothetical protein